MIRDYNEKGCLLMPAIVGVVNVNSVGSSGVLHIGDVYSIAPISTAKTFAGADRLILETACMSLTNKAQRMFKIVI